MKRTEVIIWLAITLLSIIGIYNMNRALEKIDPVKSRVCTVQDVFTDTTHVRTGYVIQYYYKLKDDKIRNDFVMMLAQAAWYIHRRRPKEGFVRVRNLDFQEATVSTPKELIPQKEKSPYVVPEDKYQGRQFPRVREIL